MDSKFKSNGAHHAMGNLRGGSSREERKSHINVLELKAAAKLAIVKKSKKINSCKDGQHGGTVLSNKDGRDKKQEIVSTSKIWNYLVTQNGYKSKIPPGSYEYKSRSFR